MSGPYLNDDGDWWVPVEDVKSFREARNLVVNHLSYEIPEDGTLRYEGKKRTIVDDEHIADDIGPMCNATCSRSVIAYHFVENRKW